MSVPWTQIRAVLNTLKLTAIAFLTFLAVVVVSLLIALMQFQIKMNEAQSQSPDFSLSQVIHLANVERNIENHLGSFQAGAALDENEITVRRTVENYRTKLSNRIGTICPYIVKNGLSTDPKDYPAVPTVAEVANEAKASGRMSDNATTARVVPDEIAARCAQTILDFADIDGMALSSSSGGQVGALPKRDKMTPENLLGVMNVALSQKDSRWFEYEINKLQADADQIIDFLTENNRKNATAFQNVLKVCDRLKDIANAVQLVSVVQFDARSIISFYYSENCGTLSLGTPTPPLQKEIGRQLATELISYYRFYDFLFHDIMGLTFASAEPSSTKHTGDVAEAEASLPPRVTTVSSLSDDQPSAAIGAPRRKIEFKEVVFAPLDLSYAILVFFSGLLGALLRYVWEVATRWGLYRTTAERTPESSAVSSLISTKINIRFQEVIVRILLAVMCALTIYVLARISLVALGDRAVSSGGLQLSPFLIAFLAVACGVLTDETFGWIQNRGRGILMGVGSNESKDRPDVTVEVRNTKKVATAAEPKPSSS